MRHERTLLYRAGHKPDIAGHGHQYLDAFDIVVVRIGTHKREAIETAGIEPGDLPTLRLPTFEPDYLWIRRNETTEELLRLWREYGESGGWEIGLLKAIYETKPLLWMLPDWRIYDEIEEKYHGYLVYACRDINDWRSTVWRDGVQVWAGKPNAHKEAGAAIAEGKGWIDGYG